MTPIIITVGIHYVPLCWPGLHMLRSLALLEVPKRVKTAKDTDNVTEESGGSAIVRTIYRIGNNNIMVHTHESAVSIQHTGHWLLCNGFNILSSRVPTSGHLALSHISPLSP
jgi:hypothetical protein